MVNRDFFKRKRKRRSIIRVRSESSSPGINYSTHKSRSPRVKFSSSDSEAGNSRTFENWSKRNFGSVVFKDYVRSRSPIKPNELCPVHISYDEVNKEYKEIFLDENIILNACTEKLLAEIELPKSNNQSKPEEVSKKKSPSPVLQTEEASTSKVSSDKNENQTTDSPKPSKIYRNISNRPGVYIPEKIGATAQTEGDTRKSRSRSPSPKRNDRRNSSRDRKYKEKGRSSRYDSPEERRPRARSPRADRYRSRYSRSRSNGRDRDRSSRRYRSRTPEPPPLHHGDYFHGYRGPPMYFEMAFPPPACIPRYFPGPYIRGPPPPLMFPFEPAFRPRYMNNRPRPRLTNSNVQTTETSTATTNAEIIEIPTENKETNKEANKESTKEFNKETNKESNKESNKETKQNQTE